jgi:hypothetical protein
VKTPLFLIGLLLAVSLAASACGIQGKPAEEDARVLRIIVVPAPQGGLDPASETGLVHLSRIAGVPLVYLRAMSSGSHLLATGVGVSSSATGEILQRLAADPAIARVEEDRRVTHQSPRVSPE